MDYLASDFHGQSGMKIYKEAAWDALEERGAAEALQILCRVNPGRILDDLEPIPVPGIAPPSRFFDRLWGMVRRRMGQAERQRG